MSKIIITLECEDIDIATYTLMFHGMMNEFPNYSGGITLNNLGHALSFLCDAVGHTVDPDTKTFYDEDANNMFDYSDDEWKTIEKFLKLNYG